MKTFLLGGLEAGLATHVTKAFEPYRGEFKVRLVPSLDELLSLVGASLGDLLLLDLDSHEGMALDWLARLAEIKAAIPILGVGTSKVPNVPEYERRHPRLFFPLLTYLRKPVRPEHLVNAALDNVRHVSSGLIEGLSLASLLQILHMEEKTCSIRMFSGRRQGFVYMLAGQVINARFRRKEGLDAVLLLLSSASPQAEIDGQLHNSTRLIHTRLEELIMEAMRLHDERLRDQTYSPKRVLDPTANRHHAS